MWTCEKNMTCENKIFWKVNSDPSRKMEDDETSQNDEIEALVSIYDDALTLLPSTSGKAFEIKINEATLNVNFPSNYPSDSSVWFT